MIVGFTFKYSLYVLLELLTPQKLKKVQLLDSNVLMLVLDVNVNAIFVNLIPKLLLNCTALINVIY